MKYRNFTVTLGALSVILLITLFFRLEHLSKGMNISGVILGGVTILGIIVGCVVLTQIVKLVNKHLTFWPIFLLSCTLSFIAFHIHLYFST